MKPQHRLVDFNCSGEEGLANLACSGREKKDTHLTMARPVNFFVVKKYAPFWRNRLLVRGDDGFQAENILDGGRQGLS